MADETVDFITEVNDEDSSSWYIYKENDYDGGIASQNNAEIFEPIEAAASQVAVKLDDAQYVAEDDNGCDGDQDMADCVEEDSNEVSEHNLILKEIINEQGLKTASYYCQECCVEYSDINDFLQQHPEVELLNEKPDEIDDEEAMVENETQDKLWDLVEEIKEAVEEEEEETITPDNAVEKKQTQAEELPLKTEAAEEALSLKGEAAEETLDRYYCYECQQVFTDLASAEEHDCMQQEQDQQDQLECKANTEANQEIVDFACAYCSQLFYSYDDLLNHIAGCQQNVTTVPFATSSTGDIVYHCEVCNKDYPTLRSYNNHQRLHKRAAQANGGGKIRPLSQPITCDICNTHFASGKNLKLHMKMHNERSLKSIQEALPAGAQTEYNELNQFYCEICNKSFDQRLLVIHKNMHQNVEEYNCSRCNKQFENLLSYEMHIQMHVENKNNSTKIPDLNQLANATNPTTTNGTGGETRKAHSCQYCGKEFQRPYEKVKHERIHTGEKPYNCEVCGKSFRVSYSLTLHLRTHTDIRPYVCATCNKRFKQQSVYVHHLKTHVAERQYKCDICGKSFRTSVQLCGHKNSHNKPFNCTECNRPFASLYAVKVHMKTHNKGHKANKNLKNRCEICGASYARIFALRYHLKEQHGLDVDPGQLLSAEYASTMPLKDMDAETAILMNAANEAQINEQLNDFMSDIDNDDGDDDDNEKDEEEGEQQQQQQQQLPQDCNFQENNIGEAILDHQQHDDDMDETEAATQAIMKTNEEIIVDNFQIQDITDW